MKSKRHTSLNYTAIFAFVLTLVAYCHEAYAQESRKPPTSVATLYKGSKNGTVSSDFSNANEIGTKFTYRNTAGAYGSSANTRYRNGQLQVLGVKGTDNGGGLTHMHEAQYGFYATRWRIAGLKIGTSTAWHPSIWSTHTNQGEGSERRDLADKSRTLDINWMEIWNYPTWNASMIDKEDGRRISILKHDIGNTKELDGRWNTWGLEYHPNYMATWEYRNNRWVRIRKVWFTSSNTSTPNKITRSARSPLYWQFSNKYHYPQGSDDTVNMFVDYFYYYKLK